jgi:hypothetical protein
MSHKQDIGTRRIGYGERGVINAGMLEKKGDHERGEFSVFHLGPI